MKTATMSLQQKHDLCRKKLEALPNTIEYVTAKAILGNVVLGYQREIAKLNGEYDDDGPVGCRADESWL